MNITIDQPCHEDWTRMQPNAEGAFCAACCKTVVDFSRKSLDEIKAYFSNRSGAKAFVAASPGGSSRP